MYSDSYENIRMMFWNGNDNNTDYNFDDKGIKYSIWRALRDYTARTDAKKVGESEASADKMFGAIPTFIDNMILYFKKTPYKSKSGYDKWHNKMCNLFISEIKESKIRSEVKYGKAQKIVNMSMKTIYCLNGAKAKADAGYFDFCHMPLDSITINWFRNYVAEGWFNNGKKRNEKIKISLEGGPLPKWSNLSFNTAKKFDDYCKIINEYDKKNPYDYMFIVTMIREYFNQSETINPYCGLTQFQAEFYIWEETQYEIAAEILAKQNLLEKLQSNNNVSVNNARIISLNKSITDIISNMSSYYS